MQHREGISAYEWRRARGELLIEAALTNGAQDWEWQTPRWGVVFEVMFPEEEARNAFRELPGVVAALDEVPDPVRGLAVHPGGGGGSGQQDPPTAPRSDRRSSGGCGTP